MEIKKFSKTLRMMGFGLASWSHSKEDLCDPETKRQITKNIAHVSNIDLTQAEKLIDILANHAFALEKEHLEYYQKNTELHSLENLIHLPIIDHIESEKLKVKLSKIIESDFENFTDQQLCDHFAKSQQELNDLYELNAGANQGWRGVILQLIGVRLPERQVMILGGVNAKGQPLYNSK